MCLKTLSINSQHLGSIRSKIRNRLSKIDPNITEDERFIEELKAIKAGVKEMDKSPVPTMQSISETNLLLGAFLLADYRSEKNQIYAELSPKSQERIERAIKAGTKDNLSNVKFRTTNKATIREIVMIAADFDSYYQFDKSGISLSKYINTLEHYSISNGTFKFESPLNEEEFANAIFRPENIAFSIIDVLKGKLPVMMFDNQDNYGSNAKTIMDAINNAENVYFKKERVADTNDVEYFLYADGVKIGKMFNQPPNMIDILVSTKRFVNNQQNDEKAFEKGYEKLMQFHKDMQKALSVDGAVYPVKLSIDKTAIGRVKVVKNELGDKQEFSRDELINSFGGQLSISKNIFQDLRPLLKFDGTPLNEDDLIAVGQAAGTDIRNTKNIQDTFDRLLFNNEAVRGMKVPNTNMTFGDYYMKNPNYGRLFSLYSFNSDVSEANGYTSGKGIGRLMINNQTLSFQELLDFFNTVKDNEETTKTFFDKFYMNENYINSLYSVLGKVLRAYVSGNYTTLRASAVSHPLYSGLIKNAILVLGDDNKEKVLDLIFDIGKYKERDKLKKLLDKYNSDKADDEKLDFKDINFFWANRLITYRKSDTGEDFTNHNLPNFFSYIMKEKDISYKHVAEGKEVITKIGDLITSPKGFPNYSVIYLSNTALATKSTTVGRQWDTQDYSIIRTATVNTTEDYGMNVKYGGDMYLPNINVSLDAKQDAPKTIQQMIDESFKSPEERAAFIQKVTDIVSAMKGEIESDSVLKDRKFAKSIITTNDVVSNILNTTNIKNISASDTDLGNITKSVIDYLQIELNENERKICLL